MMEGILILGTWVAIIWILIYGLNKLSKDE